MTAAGRVPPCRTLVVGAGVAGLAAAAQARCMGAAVRAFDTRPAVREQIESLGATFVTMDMQVNIFRIFRLDSSMNCTDFYLNYSGRRWWSWRLCQGNE